jgi:hypothetical protein
VACPVGAGRRGAWQKLGEARRASLARVVRRAWEAGASEGCKESGACLSAMSLSCASLKVEARVQVGLVTGRDRGCLTAIRAPGFRYPSPGKLKITWLQLTNNVSSWHGTGGRKILITEDRRVGGIDPSGEG